MIKKNKLMEDSIKISRESLKLGGSPENLKENLRITLRTLANLDDKSKLTDEQVSYYNDIIDNLDKTNEKSNHVKVTSFNGKKMAAIAGISFTLLAAGAGAIKAGKSAATAFNNKYAQTTETPDTKDDVKEVKSISEVNTDAVKDVEYVLPDYLNFKADDMTIAQANLIEFLNDALGKGLGTVEKDGKLVSSFNEDNLSKKVESYLCLYLSANMNNIDYKTLAYLNQEGNLTANRIYEDSISALLELYEDSYTLTNKEQEVLLNKIFADKNDVKYIKKTLALIIEFNNTKTSEERKSITKKSIELKEEALRYFANREAELNPTAAGFIIDLIDILDGLSNGKVITDNDDDIKLYNEIVRKCISKEVIEEYGIEKDISKLNADYEGSARSLRSVVRNMQNSIIVDKMDMAMNYANTNKLSDSTKSFNYMVSNIVSKVSLNNFKANKYTSNDWEFKFRNNGLTYEQFKSQIQSSSSTSNSVEKEVSASKVPDKYKKPVENYIVDKTGNEINNVVYYKAQAAAKKDAQADLVKAWKNAGSCLGLKFRSNLSKPSDESKDYNKIYNYFYNAEWNKYLKNYQANEKHTIEQNKNQDSKFEEENNQIIIDKSDNYNSPKPDDEWHFEQIEEGTVVDEGIIKNDNIVTPDPIIPDNGSNNSNNDSNTSVEEGKDVDEGIMLNSYIEESTEVYTEPTVETGIEVNENLIGTSILNSIGYQQQITDLQSYKEELLSSLSILDEYTNNESSKTL